MHVNGADKPLQGMKYETNLMMTITPGKYEKANKTNTPETKSAQAKPLETKPAETPPAKAGEH